MVLRSTHISGERPSKAKNCVGFSPARRCGVYVKKRCRLLAPKGQCRTTRWGQSGREERGGKAEMASDGSAPLSSMCPISWPPTLPTKPPQHPTQHPPCILTWMFLNSVARLHLLVITSSSPFLLFSFSPSLLFFPFLPVIIDIGKGSTILDLTTSTISTKYTLSSRLRIASLAHVLLHLVNHGKYSLIVGGTAIVARRQLSPPVVE